MESKVTQYFWDLGDFDDRKRLYATEKIASAFASYEKDDDQKYVLQRLARGAISNRGCCRQGFATALAHVVKGNEKLSTVLVWAHVREATAVTAQTVRRERTDRLVGAVLLISAMEEGGAFMRRVEKKELGRIVPEMAKLLWKAFDEKVWIREAVAQLFLRLADSLGDEAQMLDLQGRADSVGKSGAKEQASALALTLALRCRQEAGGTLGGLKVADPLADKVRNQVLPIFTDISMAQDTRRPHMLWRSALRLLTTRSDSGRDAVAALKDLVSAVDSVLPDQAAPQTTARLDHGAVLFRMFADACAYIAASQGSKELRGQLLVALFASAPKTLKLWMASTKMGARAALFPPAMHLLTRMSEILAPAKVQKTKNQGTDDFGDRTWGLLESNLTANDAAADCVAPLEVKADAEAIDIPDESRLEVLWTLHSVGKLKFFGKSQMEQLAPAFIHPLSAAGLEDFTKKILTFDLKDPQETRWVIERAMAVAVQPSAEAATVKAVLCFLFQNAYFQPTQSSKADVLVGYKASKLIEGASDLFLPFIGALEDEEQGASIRLMCQSKLWNALVILSRRLGKDDDNAQWGAALLEAWEKFKTAKAGGKKKKDGVEPAVAKCLGNELDEEKEDLRSRAQELGLWLRTAADEQSAAKGARAVASLLLCGALRLVHKEKKASLTEDATGEDEEARTLERVVDGLKKSLKKQKLKQSGLQAVCSVLSESCLNCEGLLRDMSRLCWRECSASCTDDVVLDLANLVDPPAEGKDDEDEDEIEMSEGEESEDDDDEDDVEMEAEEDDGDLQIAEPEVKKTKAEKKAEKKADKKKEAETAEASDDEEDEDVTEVSGQTLFDMLVGDEADDEPTAKMAAMFAKSAEMKSKKHRDQMKCAKLVQRLQALDLIEIFVNKHAVDRAELCSTVLRKIFAAFAKVVENWNRCKKGISAKDESGPVWQVKRDLLSRLANVTKSSVRALKGAEDIGDVKEFATEVLGRCKRSGLGGHGADIVHQLMNRDIEAPWVVELLSEALEDWATKRGTRLSEDFFHHFVERVPDVVAKLPWSTTIPKARNIHIGKDQLSLLLKLVKHPVFRDSAKLQMVFELCMTLIGRPATDFKKKDEKSRQHKMNLNGVLSVLQTAQKHKIALDFAKVDLKLLDVQGNKGGIYQMSLTARKLIAKLKEESKSDQTAETTPKRKRGSTEDDEKSSEEKSERAEKKARKAEKAARKAVAEAATPSSQEAPKKKKKKVAASA